MMQLQRNRVSSEKALDFSSNMMIVKITGPTKHYLWRHRGFRVTVTVRDMTTVNKKDIFDHPDSAYSWMYKYVQDYESWYHAAVRSTYYRFMKYYHNFKYRRYHNVS